MQLLKDIQAFIENEHYGEIKIIIHQQNIRAEFTTKSKYDLEASSVKGSGAHE